MRHADFNIVVKLKQFARRSVMELFGKKYPLFGFLLISVFLLVLAGCGGGDDDSSGDGGTPPVSSVTTWNRIFAVDGGGGQAYSAEQTADGGYIIAGSTWVSGVSGSDIALIKVDENGTEVWRKTHNISDGDEVRCVRQTSDGGYVLAGHAYSLAVGADDAWILKTNSTGEKLWSKTFDGGNNNGDIFYDVQETSDGGYVMAGVTNSYRTYAWHRDGLLIKTDGNGTELWHQLYNGGIEGDPAKGYLYSVQETPDGGFILAGSVNLTGEDDLDAWLIKTDENGTASDGHGWKRTFGGAEENDEAKSVRRTSDGGYILSGWTASHDSVGDVCGFLIKTDGNGTLDASFGTDGQVIFGSLLVDTWLPSVEETSDNGFIAAGYTIDPENVRHGLLIKTDGQGNADPGSGWQKIFNMSILDQLFSVQQTEDSGFLLAGYTAFGNPDFSMWLVKTDPLGNAPATP
jgi:hypothetical protein